MAASAGVGCGYCIDLQPTACADERLRHAPLGLDGLSCDATSVVSYGLRQECTRQLKAELKVRVEVGVWQCLCDTDGDSDSCRNRGSVESELVSS